MLKLELDYMSWAGPGSVDVKVVVLTLAQSVEYFN